MLIKGQVRLQEITGPILLIQLGDIGDVVLSLPALDALRRRFAGSGVWMCVREKAAGLLEENPAVSGVIPVESVRRSDLRALVHHLQWTRQLRRRGFAMAVDLRTGSRGTVIAGISGAPLRIGRLDHGRQRARKRIFTHLVQPDPEREKSQHAVQHHLNILQAVGVPPVGLTPSIPISREKQTAAWTLLNREGVPLQRPRVAVAPFSQWGYKEWNADSWMGLMARLLESRSVSILVTGSLEERERANDLTRRFPDGVFNLAGKTPIGLLPALLKTCRLYVGVDSGALHVAAAVEVPTVALFGPSSAVTWAPRGKRHLTVSRAIPCLPCREKGCQGSGMSRCLVELSVVEVLEAVNRQLQNEALS